MAAARASHSQISTKSAPIEHRYDPYEDNGGTSVCIAGQDYVIVASDTRQSNGYSINTRYAPKAHMLTDTCALASAGFHADGETMYANIMQEIEWYLHKHSTTEIATKAVAHMVSEMMYMRRFFPYYNFAMIAGLDEKGRGAVYTYDPVGSMERVAYQANGSASQLVQPFLDSMVGKKNRRVFGDAATKPVLTQTSSGEPSDLSLEEAMKIVKDAFTGATERDIHTGDMLEIFIIKRDGVVTQQMPLKRD
ncbi:N-terminal nucleophile aminohydrolase [Ramicandelaber brevisporus]|nr:N-terminal nucleophile aminohydrolase [Ramicandelaber brevisporus]